MVLAMLVWLTGLVGLVLVFIQALRTSLRLLPAKQAQHAAGRHLGTRIAIHLGLSARDAESRAFKWTVWDHRFLWVGVAMLVFSQIAAAPFFGAK